MHFVLVLKRLPLTTPFRGKATQSYVKYILKKYGETGMIFDFVKGLSNLVIIRHFDTLDFSDTLARVAVRMC